MKLNQLVSTPDGSLFNEPANKGSAQPQPVAARSGKHVHDLETILGVVRKINTSLVLPEVLELVVDEAIRIGNAERGFLTLADENDHLQFIIGRSANGHSIGADSFEVSSSILEDVFKTGEPICIEDALHDERFEKRMSIMKLELRTVMCAPLKTQDKTIGVIYVDSQFINPQLKEDILYLFEILAGQAAIAIQNARLYEDLRKTYEELKQANDHMIKSERMAMRGEIVGEVSHELKNLLAIVLLRLGILTRRIHAGKIEESEKILKELTQSVRNIAVFSENLLVRTRLNSQLVPTNVNTIIEEFAAFIKVLPKFRSGNIAVETDKEMPKINMDIDQIRQVLHNLTNNAIEASPNATISFKTEYDFVRNVARITVADNGPGIDPRVKEKLFNEKVTTKENGHGFGLPICKKIVEAHKGTIRVDSKPNEGTKFEMTFPVVEE